MSGALKHIVTNLVGLIGIGCNTLPVHPAEQSPESRTKSLNLAREIARSPSAGLEEPLEPEPASSAFHDHWSDGKGEVSSYHITVSRYGRSREGQLVMIYVTEPMDRRVWIKDELGVLEKENIVNVLKMNSFLSFRTGIYPYSVMTSLFSPVDGVGRERFAPAKISLSAQEWCGHVYMQIHPKGDYFLEGLHSYFSREGDQARKVNTGPLALYEDGLLIQLRELDGPFANGGDWKGKLVPSLWSSRKSHQPLGSVDATITRGEAVLEGNPVNQFVLTYAGMQRTYNVEKDMPRRVLSWSSSDGERALLNKTARLAYWRLNRPGDESFLSAIGIETPRSVNGEIPR